MELLKTLQQQLQQLHSQAVKLDKKASNAKPQNWFDTGLFSCRSSQLTDYVAEALRNLHHLETASLSPLLQNQLVQRLADQTAALVQAFRNSNTRNSAPVRASNVKTLVQHVTASSQQLYQQLSDTQHFERRLLDMITVAKQDNSAEAVQRTLALHARLGRCRKALSDIERQIQELERRDF